MISGNGENGVQIYDWEDVGTAGNVLQGNDIGTDLTGIVALGNTWHGVSIMSGCTGNTVGGGTEGVNGGIEAPVITGLEPIKGTAPPNAVLDLFADDEDEGRSFLKEPRLGSGTPSQFAWRRLKVPSAITRASPSLRSDSVCLSPSLTAKQKSCRNSSTALPTTRRLGIPAS